MINLTGIKGGPIAQRIERPFAEWLDSGSNPDRAALNGLYESRH